MDVCFIESIAACQFTPSALSLAAKRIPVPSPFVRMIWSPGFAFDESPEVFGLTVP
ncbi:MAG: hypothetical protein R2883_07735 [Caldisericia bacterium]